MLYDFVQAYRRQMAQVRIDIVSDTGAGAADSYEDYKRRVGLVQGIDTAVNLFNDLVKKYSHDSDDDITIED